MKKLFYFLVLSTSFGLSAAAEHPLHDALQTLDLEKIDMAEVNNFYTLLENVSDINERDRHKRNLLHMLIFKKFKDPENLQALIAPVFLAKLFIEKGIDINAKDNYGFTPLHYAAKLEHVKVIQVLLAHGADVNIQDKRGLTPLHDAAFLGHHKAVELLLEYGADDTITDCVGLTPLDFAKAQGKHQVIELLEGYNKGHAKQLNK